MIDRIHKSKGLLSLLISCTIIGLLIFPVLAQPARPNTVKTQRGEGRLADMLKPLDWYWTPAGAPTRFGFLATAVSSLPGKSDFNSADKSMVPAAIVIGSRVQTNDVVNVRQTPAGTILGTQSSGKQGTVTGGPSVASLNGTSFTWFNVDFDSGLDGWVADIGLNPVSQQCDIVVQGTPTISPNPVTPGNSIAVSYIIHNNGPASAGSSQTKIQIKNSSGTQITSSTFSAPSVTAGGNSSTQSNSVTIPSGSSAGTYTAFVILDNLGELNQSNTSNDSTAGVSFSVSAPTSTPTITGVNPNPVTGSTSSQPITINGTNFVNKPTVTVTWSTGSKVLTSSEVTFVSSTQLQMSINVQNDPDNWTVRVTNPSGTASNTFGFTVVAPTPLITNLSTNPNPPTTSGTFTFTISGSNFFPTGALIRVTGPGCSPCTIPNSVLTTKTTTTLAGPATLSTAGTYSFVVQNGFLAQSGADGPKSSGVNVTVNGSTSTPTISGVNPNPLTGSTSQQTVTINGTNFVNKPTVFVTWKGGSSTLSSGQVTFVSSTQLQMSINVQNDPDNWTVRVTNPSGTQSNTFGFTVVAPTPLITNLSTNPSPPTTSGAFTFTISGSNFFPTGALIRVTGPGCTPCTIPNNVLTTKTTTTLSGPATLMTAGTYSFVVQNGFLAQSGADGPKSSGVNITVNGSTSTPTITGVNPNPVTGSTSSQPLTINGTNFVNKPTVTVTWSTGSKVLTSSEVTFVSSTQLQMSINVQNDPDNWTVRVTNPSGTQSNTFGFTVVAPTPLITNLSTNPSPPTTSGAFTFTISGSNFFPTGALIRVTGPGCTPCTIPNNVLTTKTATTLSGPATLMTAGTYSFVVQNGFLAQSGADGPKSSGVNITVLAPSTDAATFVSQTISDGTQIGAGQAFTKSWTIRNAGTTTWNSNYRLRWVSGASLSNHADIAIAGSVAPGSPYTFTVPMTAPSSNGTYREDWKLLNASGGTVLVGNSSTVWVSITVNAAASQVPVASFSFTPSTPNVNQTIQFSDTSTGSPVSWQWDFNGDGFADSTAQNPTFAFNTAGAHQVTLRVSNSYGSSSAAKSVSINGISEAPFVTGVSRQYPGFFFSGPDVFNRFDVSVNWNGNPGTVRLSVNGGPTIVENGTTNGVSHTFNMGRDFPAQFSPSTISITPVNSAETPGPSWTERVFVSPLPGWASGSANTVLSSGEVKFSVPFEVPVPHWKAQAKIPTWVPYIGGQFGVNETFLRGSFVVSSNGYGSLNGFGQTGFTVNDKYSVDGSLGVTMEGRWDGPTGLQITQGSINPRIKGTIGKELGVVEAIPQLASFAKIPLVKWFNEKATLRFEISPSFEGSFTFYQKDGGFKFSDSTATVGIEPRATLTIPLSDKHLKAKAWASGTGELTIGTPQPFFRKGKLGFQFGAAVVVDLFWNVRLCPSATYNIGCTWTGGDGWNCAPGIGSTSEECPKTSEKSGVSRTPLSSSYSLDLIQPHYQKFGKYSQFNFKPSARLATSSVPVSVEEASLVTNVFLGASPQLVGLGANRLVLWVNQDSNLPVLQSTDISWSYYDGTAWTAPSLIAHDTSAELAPVAAVDSNGKIVCAWLRIKDPAFSTPINTTDDLPLFYKQLEVVTAVFDPSSKTWGPTTQLTNDTSFDTDVQISSDSAGHLLLTWLSNDGGEFMSSSATPSVLKYAFWNGSTWSPPAIIAGSLIGVSNHVAATQGTNAFVILPRDPDPAVTNDGVLDLYSWNGSGWSNSSLFAAGGVENRLPSGVYDTNGEGHVVWLRGNDLVHATISAPSPQTIRMGSASMGFYSAQLLNNPQGNLTLLWQEVVDNGPANIFAMLFDPLSKTWSIDRRLSENPEEAHDISGFYGSDGELHLAYLSTAITRISKTVPLDDGSTIIIPNIPEEGQTDLKLLDHSLVVDLAITDKDMTMTPQVPLSGDAVSVNVDIHNAGDFPIDTFGISLYAGNPDAGGTFLAASSVTGPLVAGDHRVANLSFNYPSSGGNLTAVLDPDGMIPELSKGNNRATIYLTNSPPQASVVASTTSGSAPLTMNFDASTSYDPEGDPISFNWNFADGSANQVGAITSHTFNQTGLYPVTVVVNDSHGMAATATVAVNVGCASLVIGPSSLANGKVGQPYSQSMTVAGGAPPYNFAVTAGDLPSNVSLSSSGQISGTPTQAGNYLFTVRAIYANGCTGDRDYVVSVDSVSPQASIQLSAPTYTVGEGDGRVNITLTRSGDTSNAASVSYATGNNTGKEGKDYVAAFGVLNFAAGENSKTFSVLIVDNAFVDGARTVNLTLGSATGATLSTPSTAVLTINDNDTSTGTNPIDQARPFVQFHYYDFLSRYPDQSGWDFWSNNITGCTQQPSCTEVQRINTSAAYFLSIEFQQTGYLVYRIYKAAYGNLTTPLNAPVPIRLSEFLPDTQEIGNGVIVNQGNWQQQLDNNKQAFILEFVQRERFTTAFPTTLAPAQFVDKLFSNAGLTPSATDRSTAVNEFGGDGDTSNVTGRSKALRDVAESVTLNQQEFNRAFVLMQYFGYLRRNPYDAPEPTLDYSGYNFWLGKLNQFNGNYINAEMVKAFISSTEYRQRFGP
jgi:PKD repeat protein